MKDLCPKCEEGYKWTGPTYCSFSNKLIYRCVVCGYLLFLPPKDKK